MAADTDRARLHHWHWAFLAHYMVSRDYNAACEYAWAHVTRMGL